MSPEALAALPGSPLPILPVPLANPAVDGAVVGWDGILSGWSLREVGATVGANQEKSTSTLVGAQIAATLTDTAGEQTFIAGFDVTLGIAAAAATVEVAVTGLANPLTYELTAETTGLSTLSIRFPQPLPGAAITVTVPAVGGAAAHNSVVVYGTDSASVTAVVELFSGGSAGGSLLASIAIAPGASSTQSLLADKLPFLGGLFLHVVSGSVKGTVWVRQVIPS
jgi:hypothetical protein